EGRSLSRADKAQCKIGASAPEVSSPYSKADGNLLQGKIQTSRQSAFSVSTVSLLAGARRFAEHDIHIRALAHAQQLGRGAAIGSDLEISHAAHDSEDFTGRALRIGVFDLANLTLAHNNLESTGILLKQHGGILRRDIGDEIAEPIDFQHDATQRV